MVQVDTDGNQGLFLHEQLAHLHTRNIQKKVSNIVLDENIMENNNMFGMLWNFSVISHWIFPHCFFSSPEHNVLRGSYCDRSSSIVRPSICPSVNNFFKNLLLQNQKANLDKTWQECSLGEALQKLLKEFNSNKNSGCHGNKMAENGKNL